MKQRYIILTNGRSGSNFLVDTLNQHPEVINYGEILGEWSSKQKIKKLLGFTDEKKFIDFTLSSKVFRLILQAIYKYKHGKGFSFKTEKSLKLVGFKDFVINFDKLNITDWLYQSDLKVIHLYRDNQLQRYLSLVAMSKSGIVISKKNTATKKLTVDCDDMLKTITYF